jgi:oxaloacetate decarboxylase beta subunit
MWGIGGLLITLAIKKNMEPTLLLPLVLAPFWSICRFPGLLRSFVSGVAGEIGPLDRAVRAGIANELFPLLLFIGIGAMIDFGPLLSNPRLFLSARPRSLAFSYAESRHASLTSVHGRRLNFHHRRGRRPHGDFRLTVSALAIRAGDSHRGLFVYGTRPHYPAARHPPAYDEGGADDPHAVCERAGLKTRAHPLPHHHHHRRGAVRAQVRRTCRLSDVRQPHPRMRRTEHLSIPRSGNRNIITLLLGIRFHEDAGGGFLRPQTLLILCLGLVAFVFDTVGGVLLGKLLNLFFKTKVNPMIGAAGISAFPMAARTVHKMGLAEDPHNFLLMHACGANVSGQIASVIAGGIVLAFFG